MQVSCISFRTHRRVLELETIRTRVPLVCTLASLSSAAEADSGGCKCRKKNIHFRTLDKLFLYILINNVNNKSIIDYHLILIG